MNKIPSWSGRFYEDFAVGDVYESRLGRTISEADNTWFTLLTNNTNQAHFNAVYATNAGLPGPVVNSALTLAIVAGLSVTDVSENGYNLGWTGIELPSPVYAGDTLYAHSEVLAMRESMSRPQMGLVTVRTDGINQEGLRVIRYERTVLVWKKAYAPQPHRRTRADQGGNARAVLPTGAVAP